MEKHIQLRTFRKEATDQFSELISNVRKDKDKSYIDLIDPFDDEYSEIISDTQIDTLKIFPHFTEA